MKIPKFSFSAFRRPQKKLRASTAARRFAGNDEVDYEEMSEPNMKLSRALLIVLLLHVVAVAGIIAFNTIKSRQGAFPAAASKISALAKGESAPAAAPKTEPAKSVATSAKTAPGDDAAVPRALPVNSDSGKFHVVVKGDNPVKIAKKYKVSEAELLQVNHIDDPRKLQIGQKLIIPEKVKSKK